MRYREIMSEDEQKAMARKAKRVADAHHRTSQAAHRYQEKLARVKDDEARAATLRPGPKKVRCLRSARDRQADARRVYSNALAAAHSAAQSS